MKKILLLVTLLSATGLAHAADEPGQNVMAAPSAASPAMTPAHYRMKGNKQIRLPSGDLRTCLELKDRNAIIRCAETRRKK